MNKKFLEKIEKELKQNKSLIEIELQGFAKKNIKTKGDWNTKYPRSNNERGNQSMEDAADEVEEYANRLPVEHSLELRLRDINLALEKIQKGNYGKCEKCKKNISEQRLKVYPEARTCTQCNKKS
jgi:RNA polymerase-binding transcription factor DksA